MRALAIFAVSVGLFFGVSLAPRTARAQTPMGTKSQLIIDQISGFRMSKDGSVNYYGPVGFSSRSYTQRNFDPRLQTDTTFHFTTFWLAPSADFFIIDHLSIGGLVELSTTSTSIETVQPGAPTLSISEPSTTSITLLPRVGWLFNIGERFAIWPRGGLGYISRQTISPTGRNNDTTDTYKGAIIDIDVGFLYRIAGTWFVKAAPELSFSPGGSHSVTDSITGTTTSASASAFQFAIVTGIGAYIDL